MSEQSIKSVLTAQMKEAMKAKDKERLGTIRLMLSEIKQIEVDERIDLSEDDVRVLSILDKMLKQRRDSIDQFTKAGRDDLAVIEQSEIVVIQSFMPEQMSDADIIKAIDEAMKATGATSVKDMGKVMGILKPKMQGRVDMAVVGARIKERLNP